MSIHAMIAAIPVFQRLNARQNFVAVAAIPLRDWDQLWKAEDWCNIRWDDYGRQYRRSTREEDRHAVFEFPCDDDAVEFLMKFG